MKLQLDDQGKPVFKDNLPVYVHDDGTESPFDAAATVATIRERNAEAQRNRERYEAAEGKLKAFEGIADPAAALKAIDVVSKLDQKKLIEAGQVDSAIAAALQPVQEKLAAAEERANKVEQQYHSEVVGGSFARSKFIADKLILPPDIAQSAFGNRFKVEEDGMLRAYDEKGNAIFSRKSPGAHAGFDEAIEILVEAHPRKDSILRANNTPGSNTPAGGGGGGGSGKQITRAQYEAMDAATRHQKVVKEGATVVDG